MLLSTFSYKAASFISTYNYAYVPYSKFYDNLYFIKFQRPAEESHLKMIRDLKYRIRKIPIIVDYDDYVFDIPAINVASTYYKDKENFIKESLEIADGVTVSTEYLKNKLLKFNKNISVVPNYQPKFLWGEPIFRDKSKKPKILYPGSTTHFNQNGSGGDFGSELVKFIEKTTDEYEWHFIGACPFELKNNHKIFIHKWQAYFAYPNFIKNLNPTMAIAPLEVNEFNKCKSDIKFQEYTAAGICGIYQNIEPYKNASLKASSSEEFISLIKEYAYDPNKQYEIWNNDLKSFRNGLFLEGNELKWFNNHLRLFNRRIK